MVMCNELFTGEFQNTIHLCCVIHRRRAIYFCEIFNALDSFLETR